MPDRLPLFPLGVVLFPGAVLPLHVFEDRYRVLVGELVERPEEERRFGVVTIRQGREVGEDGVGALHSVGTVARVRRVSRYDDGRYDLVTTGEERFHLEGVERGKPYVQGQVTWLPDDVGDDLRAPDLERAVRSGMSAYLAEVSRATGGPLEAPDLPEEPRALSYAVAGALLLDLDDRQSLLEKTDATTRLSAELALLRRETSLLRALSAAPSPELARTPVNPN